MNIRYSIMQTCEQCSAIGFDVLVLVIIALLLGPGAGLALGARTTS